MKKWVKKVASIVSGFIIVLALGGYFFVRNFDLNRYKPYIENIVYDATGRTLKMEGDAHLAVSLIPTIEINNVSLSNPEWAQSPNMVEMDKLEVQFAVTPLLEKRIVIDKFILHGTKVYLEKSTTDENNWTFGRGAKTIKTGAVVKTPTKTQKVDNVGVAAAGMVLIAKKVEVTDGLINYFDAETNENHSLEIKNFSANLKGLNEPLEFSTLMLYNGEKIKLDALFSTPDSIISQGEFDFEAKLDALNVKGDITGTARELFANPLYAMEGIISSPNGNFSLPETNLDFRVEGDLVNVNAIIRKLALAENEVSGTIAVKLDEAKPFVKADLVSTFFNVNDLIGSKKQAFVMPSLISSANALSFVPADDFSLSFLNVVNGNVALKIGDLMLPEDIELSNIDMTAKLQNGNLIINPLSVGFGGGKIAGDVIANANDNSIRLNLKSDGMKLQEIDKSFADKKSSFSVNNGGDLMLDVSLATSGSTYRKLSENVSGQLVAIMDKTSIRGANMSWLTNNVIGQLLSLLKVDTTKARNLDVKCAVVRSDFKGGKAYFPSSIAFNSEQLKMVGSGDVNLVNDNINFTIAPTLNKLADGNITQALASFVKIEGTLNNPKLRLDTSSAISTIVGAVATGGISLGGEVLLSGDDDPCRSALEGTKYANKFKQTTGAKSSTKRAYQEVNKQAKNAVKEIGNAAKNLLDAFAGQF